MGAITSRKSNTINNGTCSSSSSTNMNLSAFAFNLFSALSSSPTEDGRMSNNILISPYSLASALSLVLAGSTAGGPCQQELRSVLGLQEQEEDGPLRLRLSSSDEKALTTANGIWAGAALKDSYVALVRNGHGAEAAPLPLTYGPISGFINQATHGLIENMLGDGPVDPLVVAVLVNAVHFKSAWTVRFDKKNSRSGTFVSCDNVPTQAMFMRATRHLNVAEDVAELHGAHMVELDYGTTKDFAAYFILPQQAGREELEKVVKSLAMASFPAVLDDNLALSRNKMVLSLPRFQLRSSPDKPSVKEGLRAVGVTSCFAQDGGLLEMSDDPRVRLDDVLHQAVLEVTEEGTEAAAATVAIVKTRSLPPPPRKLTFDRPFLMLILHRGGNDNTTTTPLFLARVEDPQFVF